MDRLGTVSRKTTFGAKTKIHRTKPHLNSYSAPNYKYMFGPHRDPLAITKTRLYNFDPLKPHFYIVKLGFTGVYIIFLISAQKHRLWVLDEAVLTSIYNLCFEQKYEKYQSYSSENF